jgi:hypothetical protein
MTADQILDRPRDKNLLAHELLQYVPVDLDDLVRPWQSPCSADRRQVRTRLRARLARSQTTARGKWGIAYCSFGHCGCVLLYKFCRRCARNLILVAAATDSRGSHGCRRNRTLDTALGILGMCGRFRSRRDLIERQVGGYLCKLGYLVRWLACWSCSCRLWQSKRMGPCTITERIYWIRRYLESVIILIVWWG